MSPKDRNQIAKEYLATPSWHTVRVLSKRHMVSSTEIIAILVQRGIPCEKFENRHERRMLCYKASSATERLGAMMAGVYAAQTEEGRNFCRAYSERKRGERLAFYGKPWHSHAVGNIVPAMVSIA